MKKIIIEKSKKYTFLDTVLLKYQDAYCFSDININLKHALKIIHNFNINNKMIWFVGLDLFIDTNRLNLNSRNVFLPSHFWSKGLIGNKKYVKPKTKNYNFKSQNI